MYCAVRVTLYLFLRSAFDTPAPTFRHEEFPEYKAQRGAPPDDLYPQFGRIRQVAGANACQLFHIDS